LFAPVVLAKRPSESRRSVDRRSRLAWAGDARAGDPDLVAPNLEQFGARSVVIPRAIRVIALDPALADYDWSYRIRPV